MKKWICLLVCAVACGVTNPGDVGPGLSADSPDTAIETSSSQQTIAAELISDDGGSSALSCGREVCAPDERCCSCSGPGGQRFRYCDSTCPVGSPAQCP
jgi:hypothetical protein